MLFLLLAWLPCLPASPAAVFVCLPPLLLQVIDITYDVSAGPEGLLPALKDVCDQAQVRTGGEKR